MPDHLTKTITLNAWKLENLRDTLRERADHLQDWMKEIEKIELVDHAGTVLGNVCAQSAAEFLFELHGDLDDWARFLTAQTGDDAE